MRTHRILIFILASVEGFAQPASSAKKSVPVDPIAGILEAFRSHSIVAVDEGRHNNQAGYDFRLALIRDPRFAGTVNDIVVEAGSARYQDVMDRFTSGEDVPYEVLRQVWQNTTQPDALWDSPIYEQFYRAVRTLNAGLPRARRIRVLLGEPPIDWGTIKGREDWNQQLLKQNEYPAEMIRREVLAKGRHALIVYGGGHLTRAEGRSIVGRLEQGAPGSIFTICTNFFANLEAVQKDLPAWPVPTLVPLQGTALGATPYGPNPNSSVPLQNQFDAMLYLGPVDSVAYIRAPRTLCMDRDYVQMRLKRLAVLGDPQTQEQFCAGLAARQR